MNKYGHYTTTVAIPTTILYLKPEWVNLFNIEEWILLLSIYFVGSLIPDSDNNFKYLPFYEKTRYWEYHRQITHSLIVWIPLFIFSILFEENINIGSFSIESIYLTTLVLGVFSHLIPDMITGNIPFLYFFTDDYRQKFPKRIGFYLFGRDINRIMVKHFENACKYFLFYASLFSLYYVFFPF